VWARVLKRTDPRKSNTIERLQIHGFRTNKPEASSIQVDDGKREKKENNDGKRINGEDNESGEEKLLEK
jgi:hypothetical protein